MDGVRAVEGSCHDRKERIGDSSGVICLWGSKAFVLRCEKASGPGVYTCARTRLRRNRKGEIAKEIVGLRNHFLRLKTGFDVLCGVLDDNLSIETVQNVFEVAIMEYGKLYRGEENLMVTLFFQGSDKLIRWHAMPLPRWSSSPVFVLAIRGRTLKGNRESLAAVKCSRWISERQELEKKYEPVTTSRVTTELILLDKSFEHVLEGLVTNVFVVRFEASPSGGESILVETAEDDVLHGTMRASVLEACQTLGISVRLSRGPKIADAVAGKWIDMFLTSVTKPVVHVDSMMVEKESGENLIVEFKSEHAKTSQIREAVSKFL